MPRKKVEEPVVEAVEETVEEPVVEKGSIVVVNELGTVMRVFSKQDHGKEAEELAESFAKKFGYKIV